MKQNIDFENATVTFAPWVEQMVRRKEQATLPTPIIDSECKATVRNNPTDPIYSLEGVERIKMYCLSRHGHEKAKIRDYAYIVFSLNTCRRAGDILALHVYDVLDYNRATNTTSFKSHIIFDHEQKTGKKSVVYMNDSVRDALTMYFNSLESFKMSDWLFPSTRDSSKPMEVQGMRKMLQRTVEALGIDMHMGTHSLRKTLPYHAIKNSKCTEDEVMVSQFLNHNNIKTTYHYIKRSQDEMDQFVKSNSI